MSQMPTLFDDEEYFVPPPQKETKKNNTAKKEKRKTDDPATDPDSEASADPEATGIDTSEGDAAHEEHVLPDLEMKESAPLEEKTMPDIEEEELMASESPVVAEPEQKLIIEDADGEIPEEVRTEVSSFSEEEDLAADEVSEPEVSGDGIPEITTESLVVAEPMEEPIIENVETEISEHVVIEESSLVDVNSDAEDTALIVDADTTGETEDPEVPAETAPEAPADTTPEAIAGQNITFEIPETEDEEHELEISVAPIKEDPVDNLDKLMFTEMLAADYTSYAGLSFEPTEPPVEETKAETDEDPEYEVAEAPVEEAQTDEAADTPVTALPEFDLEDKYYTIGEVARMFGVNVSHIRFWTTEFKLKVRTTRKGDRLYNPENIGKLRLIHHLVKENKHTIKGAKEQLKSRKPSIDAQVALKDKLSSLKAQLERIKRNL